MRLPDAAAVISADVRTMSALSAEVPDPSGLRRSFDRIVLAAADEDADAFDDLAKIKYLPRLDQSVSVYHSGKDWVLDTLSAVTKFNGPRLGSDGPDSMGTISDKVSAIDVSDVISSETEDVSFPSAARLTLLVSGTPIVLKLLAPADHTLIYIAGDLVLTTMLLMTALATYHCRLVKLVASRVKIAARRERSRIAEAIALEEKAKAKEMAETDTFTKLPNRRGFLNPLDRAIEQHSSGDGSFAVAKLDLDGFKPINDSFGHAIGDLLLVEVAGRLLVAAGSQSIVARLGGDEFSIILPHASSAQLACQAATTICDDLAKPFSFEHVTIRLSASCGVALCPNGDEMPVACSNMRTWPSTTGCDSQTM